MKEGRAGMVDAFFESAIERFIIPFQQPTCHGFL